MNFSKLDTKMIKIFSIAFLLISCLTLKAQDQIEWLSFEEAVEMQKVNRKKIIVDLYTDWCIYCKRMDKATFQKKHIADYINSNFYPVKLDGEQMEDIEYGDRTYKYVKNGPRGYHELAVALTEGRLSYPTLVFIDEDMKIIQAVPGYRSPMDFEMIMSYYGENQHKNMPWSNYQDIYVPIRMKNKRVKLTSDN